MFLKSLVLRGFKSFAERTSLTFEPGISVVVGPNGSGKSNVVDAICWVLGEQGPAALRGGRMEDVIFAGSGLKPALGMAEVLLTIDNSAGLLPIEFGEVTISRSLFRSGDSEYRLNGSLCRLLDIQELLSDAGVGREQHIIVGQGRLDEVLSADPQQMRLIIEEAAGVGKHRRRKERALRKIAAAESNLVHLGNLLAEIRRQLKPLRQQADAAQRHELMQQEIRRVRLALDASRLAELVTSLDPLHGDLESQVSAMEGEVSEIDARLVESGERKQELHALAAEQREMRWRLSASAERLASIKRLADERLRSLRAELSSSNQASGEAQIAELVQQLDEARTARLAAVEAEAAQVASFEQSLEVLEAAKQASFLTASALTEERDANLRLAAQISRLLSELASVDAESVSARLQQERQAEQRHEDERRLKDLRERQARTGAALKDLIAKQEALSSASSSSREALGRLEERRSALLEEIRATERHAALAQARSEVMSGNASSETVHAILRRSNGAVALLGDLVDLPAGHRRALEAFLGPLDRVLIASRTMAAEILAGHDSEEPMALLVAEASGVVVEGAEPLLSGAQSTDPRVISSLADVYLAPSVEAAVRLAGQHRHAVFVTVEGAVASGGLVSSGSEDVVHYEKLRGRLHSLNAELRELDGALAATRADVDRARDEAGRLEAEVARATERARLEELERDSLSNRIGQGEQATRRVEESQKILSDRRQALAEELSRTQNSKTESDLELERLDADSAAARATLDEASSVWDAARMARGQLAERRRLLDERLEGLEARMSTATRSLSGIGERRLQIERAMEKAASVARIADYLRVGVTLWVNESGAAHQSTLDLVTEVEDRVAELRSAREVLAADLEEVSGLARQEDLARSELKVRLRILEASIREQWQVEPEQLMERARTKTPLPGVKLAGALAELEGEELEQLMSLDELALEARRSRLERQLVGVGVVNPLAAREAEALAEREAFLASQLDDVRKSRRDLLRVVESVDEKIRDLFASAYADVAVEFGRLFELLFPLGRGALRLTDPQDMLTSGVEVEAGPTGRNLKRLSLLSGGERALSALAVLFAIFRARPSPFYILDEVEAALDDVNLHRFLGLLREFRDSSQLLVVTHQKRTMEIADVLYGVAIRPDGVSKVISERLSELFPA